MTTKFRIIGGFAVLLALLGVMAFFGYTSLQTGLFNFNDYRRLANVNVDSSDLKSSTYEAMYFTQLYMDKKKPEQIQSASQKVENGLTVIKHVLDISIKEDTITMVKQIQEKLNAMKKTLGSLQANVEKVFHLLQESCLPYMEQTDAALMALAEGGRANANYEALYYQTQVWRNIAVVRENMVAYLTAMEPEAGKKMISAMEGCQKAIDGLATAAASEQGHRDYEAIASSFSAVMKGFPAMIEAGSAARANLAELESLAEQIVNVVITLNDVSDAAMRENGAATLSSSESAQFRMLGISALGLLLGLAFAAVTIIMLVRTLNKISQFTADIADGNFTSTVDIREKGEIGAMFQSMRRIPEIFSGVISRCNDIANDISSGLFRDRLDPGQFNGGFKDLAQGINAIADSYTRSIDSLPVAIITLDTRMKTKFTNTTGAKMVGDDALRAFGGKMPLLESSVRENKRNSQESRLTTPEGQVLDVAATALPMRNLKGETVGGLEVLSDISEIKQKQNIMLEVATQASAISDRVAAASEELAAQVEQVSRGAEIQRERVESTASAMTQMNSTVTEVARSASEASEQSEQTRANAQSGSALVNKVVGAINEVNAIASRLQSNMRTLGDQAESIGSVMNVISDIADQTNLLALNAAIEAARAGEAGRGFAVVADEVRKLAEKTMTATKEVGDNISAIQHSTQMNIDEVAVAGKSVGEATALANESGQALQGILDLASSTSSVVSSIATAAEQQSAASEEITHAVDEINRLVSETTEGMIQSSSAVQDLSRTAQELRRVMEGLR